MKVPRTKWIWLVLDWNYQQYYTKLEISLHASNILKFSAKVL